MSDHLPEEIVREILLRLPVISLVRSRSVCKSWYSLITHPNFISTHLAKSLVSNPCQFFLHQESYDSDSDSKSSLSFFDNKNQFDCVSLNLPSRFRVVGSCCGIVCLFHLGHDRSVQFILCNPSTGNSLSIPSPRPNFIVNHLVPFTRSGFVYNESSKDFKILCMIRHDNNIWDGQIYSLDSNTWRNITTPIPCLASRFQACPSVFVHGGLHWLVSSGSTNLVLVFDLEQETFSQMSLPECLKGRGAFVLSVKKFGESSIAVIYRPIFPPYNSDIWVMKEYGAVESWTKIATIGEQNGGKSEVLGFINDDEVLIKFKSGQLASQTLESNVFENMVYYLDKKPRTYMFDYAPSLLLLDKGAMDSVIGDIQS